MAAINVDIRDNGGGSYSLFVPKGKKHGGKFFFDEKLLSFVSGGFESIAGKMKARFTSKQLSNVIKRIYDLGEVFKADRDDFNEIFPSQGGGVRENIQHYKVSETSQAYKAKQTSLAFSKTNILPSSVPVRARDRIRMATTGYSGNIVRNTGNAAALLASIRKSAQEVAPHAGAWIETLYLLPLGRSAQVPVLGCFYIGFY